MKKRNVLVIIAIILMILPYFINYYTFLRILSYFVGLLLFGIILFKSKKNVIVNIIVILTIFISSYFIDYVFCHKERIPFMAQEVISSDKVTSYYSLLYQVNICNKKWNLDKFYKKGFTCKKGMLDKISINDFLSTYESNKNSYLKISGKISQIVGEKYIEVAPYENGVISQNGEVIFKQDIILRLPLTELDIDIKKFKIYDEIEFIGRVIDKTKEEEKNIYLFDDVIIYQSDLYNDYELIVEKDNNCELDKTEYVKINDLTYYVSCLKNIDVKFNEENIYDLDYVLLDEKITLDNLLKRSITQNKDSFNNTLYELKEFKILVCNNNEIVLGKNISLESNYCEANTDESV